MSNVEAIPVAAMFMTFSYLIAREVMGASRRKEEARLKHETYQKLLATGQLDRKTLEEILMGVEGRRREGGFFESLMNGSVFFILGWLGIFVGLALLVGGSSYRDREVITAGWIVGLISLGVATLPLAWREIQVRFRPEGEEHA